MLTCQNLTLSVNNKKLFDLSFSLFRSSITLIKGSNGAGKTSLLKIIAGLKKPDTGEVLFHQINISQLYKPYAIYLGHELALKTEISVFEYLSFCSQLYNSEPMLHAAIHYLNLFDILDRKIYTLSAGNKKKVAMARLLACHADIWLIDEIAANLDADNQQILLDIMATKAQNGGIVIITSHQKLPLKIYNEIELGDCND